jgi:TolB-like protein/Flp pilus assembly protein TadD
MGEVYRARDTRLGRDVAIKVLPADVARDADRLNRFRREAKSLAAIDHPNIVTVFSVEEASAEGAHDVVHFLTMQLVQGESLDRVIPEAGLPLDRILEISAAIADALAAAHDKSIVHRDLKPANVMVADDGRVKVLDFGLAKDLTASGPADATLTSAGHTEYGVVMGTPAYMSPEQVAGRAVDHRSDLFSLGILMHQMASGQRPFGGASSIELASAILRDTPALVTDGRSELPDELARLIRRCLEKDPRQRIQTARDVGNECRDLQRLTSGASPVRRSASTATPSGSARQDEGFWIAVLPFKYAGANADLTALAEGLTEEIVTGLSRFSYLRVIGHGSTARHANRTDDVRAVAKELGARYVMEGSVRQAGSQLRVAVQLVDATTGAHLWAETYNRAFQPDSIFDVQDEVVPRIVSTVADLHGVLPHSMSEAVRLKPADQLSPYEAVLRSFGYTERVSPEELSTALSCLELALEKAPSYADAWAMLASLFAQDYAQGFNVRADSLTSAGAAARRAVEAAPSNHLAATSLAQVLFLQKEFGTFRHVAERAVALNPMDGNSIAFLGELLAYAGDWKRGHELSARSKQLNPHHPGWYWYFDVLDAYRQGDYRSARDFALKVNLPGHWADHTMLAATSAQLGERESAAKAVRDLLKLRPDFATTVRAEMEKWWEPELVEHLIDGLRKAGLEVEDPRPRASSLKPQAEHLKPQAASPKPQSIAVMPFTNMSADKDQDYFSEALAEEIINALVKVPGLKVIARTSSFALKDHIKDIRKVAEVLGVTNVLEGSVRRSGPRLRVTAQLVAASDGTHLWSERYDRQIQDLFEIQDEIAAAIAAELKLKFSPDAAARPRRQPNLQAYEAYLRYLHHQWGFTQESLRLSRECLEQAIALDPEFALPYAGLADHHLASTVAGVRADEAMPRTRELARRALEADPDLPEAHGLLGIVAGNYDRDWKEAERRFGLAMARHPVPWHVRQWHSYFYLLSVGRTAEALGEAERTIEDDPLSQVNYMCLGCVLDAHGRRDDAGAALTKGLELDPQFWWGWCQLGMHHAMHGNRDRARHCARKAFAIFPSAADNIGLMAGVLAIDGESARADALLAQFTADAYGTPLARTCFHLVCGEIDAALAWAEKAIDQRRPTFFQSTLRPFQGLFRKSHAWSALLRRMNLTE